MTPFERYEHAKNKLIIARLQETAIFLEEHNDETTDISLVHDHIKVNYKNDPYFKRSKELWRDIETPLERITPKEFTVNPLKKDKAFTEELMFKYDNRFNNDATRIQKYFENTYPGAIGSKGETIATLGDCQKKAEALGIIRPEYSLNDIEAVKNYWINFAIETLDTHKLLKKAQETIKKEQGNKND